MLWYYTMVLLQYYLTQPASLTCERKLEYLEKARNQNVN